MVLRKTKRVCYTETETESDSCEEKKPKKASSTSNHSKSAESPRTPSQAPRDLSPLMMTTNKRLLEKEIKPPHTLPHRIFSCGSSSSASVPSTCSNFDHEEVFSQSIEQMQNYELELEILIYNYHRRYLRNFNITMYPHRIF
jgi:hypothetical protein